jgi:SCY1-like protein 1
MTLHSTKSSATVPTITSPDPSVAFDDEAEDFDNDWGGFANDDNIDINGNAAKANDDPEDAWGAPSVSKPSTTTSYDDNGEPDFAGWLAAQSQGKRTVRAPLPKGLTKSTTSTTKTTRPVIGGRSSTTGSATTARKTVAPPKKEVEKEEPKAKEDEEEGWGDAW